MPLSEIKVSDLLRPFGVKLSPEQITKLLVYLDLLLRWNAKINLTAIRTPEECVTRHFGESLLLGRYYQVEGTLLDVGSGAGFPALALKIALPQLQVCLLEPVAKKRAFLKEVARVCEFTGVDVRPERVEDMTSGLTYDSITMRAVGAALVKISLSHLKPTGKAFFWLSMAQMSELSDLGLQMGDVIEVPGSRERIILPCSLKG